MGTRISSSEIATARISVTSSRTFGMTPSFTTCFHFRTELDILNGPHGLLKNGDQENKKLSIFLK